MTHFASPGVPLDVPAWLLRKLQVVQNAAARIIAGTKKYEHATPVLREQNWLPAGPTTNHVYDGVACDGP